MTRELDFQSRQRRRAGKRRTAGRPLVFILEALLCLTILAAVGWEMRQYLYRSDDFLVKTVRVEGVREVKPQEILKKAGITTADSIMSVDVDAVRKRVLQIAFVKTCRVTRSFPDKVVISIQERIPTATLMVDNHAFEIDSEGVVLRELPSNASHPGPYISNVPGLGFVEVGEHLKEPALQATLKVWAAFSKMPIAKDLTVSEFSATSENDIRMFCDELPYEIRWGRGDYTSEAARLNLLWHRKHKQLGCTEYLDLRFGEDVACK